ncbi:MAG: hypothetical protein GXO10_01295 [Crenarchaeota archaeon]|nr:hypothetical protein [Thermoproteota archaeon]
MAFDKFKVDKLAIDYALFNQRAEKVLPTKILVEYDATKLALLDVVRDHASTYNVSKLYIESTDYTDPEDVAIESATLFHKNLVEQLSKHEDNILVENAKRIAKKLMRRGMELEAAVAVGTEAAFAKLLITDMTIKPVLYESPAPEIVDPQARSLLQETYRILLDELIETVMPYINITRCCA